MHTDKDEAAVYSAFGRGNDLRDAWVGRKPDDAIHRILLQELKSSVCALEESINNERDLENSLANIAEDQRKLAKRINAILEVVPPPPAEAKAA